MYVFTDDKGTFELKNAEKNSYLYFPVCNEAGLMGCVTPTLGGDLCLDQNHFILQPVSVEELHNNRSSRNFWLKFEDGAVRSVTGASVWQRAEGSGEVTVKAGLLWHETTTAVRYGENSLEAVVTLFAPAADVKTEIMRVRLKNTGNLPVEFEPVAVIPLYGRSASNLRDHRHVTSLLHRIKTEEYGVSLKPTLSFDERGHLKNTTEYFVAGTDGKGKAPKSFYPTVMSVTGEGGSFEMPFGIMESSEGVPAGSAFEGVEAVGGLKFEKCVLEPGERAEYLVFTGAGETAPEGGKAGENTCGCCNAGNGTGNKREGNIEKVIRLFGASCAVEKALEDNKAFWLEKAKAGLGKSEGAAQSIAKAAGISKDVAENYLLWVAVEPVLRRIFGCSFLPYHDYGKGGRGWRDLWQDCLALMLGDPSSVRDLLINNFAGVRADGTNATIIGSKPGEFIADRNGIARVWMDHGVWTWITMKLYSELSGDTAIFDTEQVYFKDLLCNRARGRDERASEDEGFGKPYVLTASGDVYRGTLLEHLLLMQITAVCDVGDHGNLLLRGADWNDALDMADKKGESVAFSAAYAGNLREMAAFLKEKGGRVELLKEIAELVIALGDVAGTAGAEGAAGEGSGCGSLEKIVARKRSILDEYCNKVSHRVSGEKVSVDASELAGYLEAAAGSVAENIRNGEIITSKDGLKWINGYYDNEGKPAENIDEKRLMLTGAVFAIMSGTLSKEETEQFIKTADRFLFDEKAGGYRLNTRFENEEYFAHNLGRMFGFAYGTKENGAVFCHMAVMYAYALLIRGFKDEALKGIGALVRQSLDFEHSRVYPGIPEYFGQEGRGMYPYLTGAASWMLLFLYRLANV